MHGSSPSQPEAPPSTRYAGNWDWLIYSQLITLNQSVGRVEGTLATVVDTQKAQGRTLKGHDREISKLKAATPAPAKSPLLSFTSLKDHMLSLAALIYAAVLLFYLVTGQIDRANQIISSGASRLQTSEAP